MDLDKRQLRKSPPITLDEVKVLPEVGVSIAILRWFLGGGKCFWESFSPATYLTTQNVVSVKKGSLWKYIPWTSPPLTLQKVMLESDRDFTFSILHLRLRLNCRISLRNIFLQQRVLRLKSVVLMTEEFLLIDLP